jgi:hypothetical protein
MAKCFFDVAQSGMVLAVIFIAFGASWRGPIWLQNGPKNVLIVSQNDPKMS